MAGLGRGGRGAGRGYLRRDGDGAGYDREALAKADARASAAAARAAEAEAALARRDMPRATELLRDPDAYHAFHARAAGGEWRPPVAKAVAGPDRRAEIREAVAEDDFGELDRLVRPDGGRQYHELLTAGDLAEAAAEGIAKRSRTPAQVPAAEVNRWRERIKAMLEAKDRKGMDAARRAGAAGFQAAWIAMWAAGKRVEM